MRCIFCKNDSSLSVSREHIIPQSLGNIDHFSPPGIVCDRCNNYFSRKVERPVLEAKYFRDLCFQMTIPSKKRKIPKIRGVHLEALAEIELAKSVDDQDIAIYSIEGDGLEWREFVRNNKKGTLIFPMSTMPDQYMLSRMLAKISLEVLAFRIFNGGGDLEEIIDKPELDELRSYARYGTPDNIWPFSVRTIYSPDHVFSDGIEAFEILNEFDILVTKNSKYYIVIAIFGVEYALNLGGREISGYQQWLTEHDGESPLYVRKIL